MESNTWWKNDKQTALDTTFYLFPTLCKITDTVRSACMCTGNTEDTAQLKLSEMSSIKEERTHYPKKWTTT